MKKTVSLIVCLTMLLSLTAVIPAASAAQQTAPMEATVWEDFGGYKKGAEVKKIVATEEEGSVKTVDDLGAIGGVNAVQFSYSSLRGYNFVAGDQGFKLTFNRAKSLENVDCLMLYVKMPTSAVDTQGSNWGKTGFSPMMYLGDGIWTSIKENLEISYLPLNSSAWRTATTYGMYVNLPSAFEGYVKIPVDYYKAENLTDSIHNHSVESLVIQFAAMGGACGSAYINAIYGVTENTDSTMVCLNGDATARYLLNGGTAEDVARQSNLLSKAMTATVVQDFSGYSVGYDLLKNGCVTIQHKADATATLCESVGGFFKTPSVKLSAKTYGGFHDVDPYYDVAAKGMTDMSNMKAFLFYVKCASAHPMKQGVASIRFNIHSEKNYVPQWTLLGNSKIMAMQKGTGVWKSYAAQGDGNGIVDLPDNFEGYIMVNIEDMLTNPIADDLEGRLFLSSTMQFQAVGGECGDCYIGPLYMITEMAGKNNKLITFDGCDVYSLATDSYATENDLLNIGPVVDRVYDSFPMNTCDKYPTIRAVTKNSAVIEWEPTDKATEYRVDVYCGDNSTGNFAYRCTHSLISKECALRLDELEEGLDYYVCIVATDASGMELATYNHQSFTTRSDSTELAVQKTETGKREAQTDSDLHVIIVCVIAGVLVVGAAVTVTVILLKKRKVRAQR